MREDQSPRPLPVILVVDDDPSFARIMQRTARELGIVVAAFRSLEEIKGKLSRQRFQAAIVDYDLGTGTGIELAAYLERFLERLPVILVSQSAEDIPPRAAWPRSVNRFLKKTSGHARILRTALRESGYRPRAGERRSHAKHDKSIRSDES